jgi:hypothetical protein
VLSSALELRNVDLVATSGPVRLCAKADTTDGQGCMNLTNYRWGGAAVAVSAGSGAVTLRGVHLEQDSAETLALICTGGETELHGCCVSGGVRVCRTARMVCHSSTLRDAHADSFVVDSDGAIPLHMTELREKFERINAELERGPCSDQALFMQSVGLELAGAGVSGARRPADAAGWRYDSATGRPAQLELHQCKVLGFEATVIGTNGAAASSVHAVWMPPSRSICDD